jgi:hypothetical protein
MIKLLKKVVKLCLIAGTVMLVSSTAYAQIEVGAKLGVNINQFNQPGTIFGFNGGAFARYPVLDFVSVRAELLYMQQGGERSPYTRNMTGSGADGNITSISYSNRYVNLNNLEVPILAEITHPDFIAESIKPKLLLGVAYGFLLSATESSERTYFMATGATPQITFSDNHDNVRSNYEHNNVGLIAGVAIDYKIGERTFTTEVRYRRSLTQLNLINSLSNQVPGQFGNLYSSTLSINFGMTLFNF